MTIQNSHLQHKEQYMELDLKINDNNIQTTESQKVSNCID